MIIEILWPCYNGSEVEFASGKMSTSLFHSEWYTENRKFRETMLVFMERANQPIKINVFGFYDVNLKTFTFVCKGTFSLFV